MQAQGLFLDPCPVELEVMELGFGAIPMRETIPSGRVCLAKAIFEEDSVVVIYAATDTPC